MLRVLATSILQSWITLCYTLNMYKEFPKMFIQFSLNLFCLMSTVFAISSNWGPYLFVSSCVKSIHFFVTFPLVSILLYLLAFYHSSEMIIPHQSFWFSYFQNCSLCILEQNFICHFHFVLEYVISDFFYSGPPRHSLPSW